ncbi:nucleotide sugar dehydrogenase [Flavobacteriaceae bacterium]|nr:nucleotide sugar dehydrogenase [Flavobacteriaceae bacterium]
MQIKNICCIGAGYVGGPTMSVIALKCPQIKVTVVDVNHDKINAWNGPLDSLPVYEPGLPEIVGQVRDRNLFFSVDLKGNIEKAEMIFMAVNTPTKTKGEGAGMAADLRHIEACARDIAKYAKNDKIIIEKSTLPVRTAEKIKEILDSEADGVNFEILSNPEFLAEGTAIEDLFKSDRVLIGGENSPSSKRALKSLVEIYEKWIPKNKILTMGIWTAELAKLASNAMLAQRISSINSLSALCENTGADINELSIAIGMDHRIGPYFLEASVGFGGSCFQKDILNLVYLSKYYGLDEVAEYWHYVIKINDYQKKRFSKKILQNFGGEVKNKRVCVLGWAFKPNTNDSRESSSIYVAVDLLRAGASLNIYDPLVDKNRIIDDLLNVFGGDYFSIISKKLNICSSIHKAIKNVDSIGILTEWEEFKLFNWDNVNHIPIYWGHKNLKRRLKKN